MVKLLFLKFFLEPVALAACWFGRRKFKQKLSLMCDWFTLEVQPSVISIVMKINGLFLNIS